MRNWVKSFRIDGICCGGNGIRNNVRVRKFEEALSSLYQRFILAQSNHAKADPVDQLFRDKSMLEPNHSRLDFEGKSLMSDLSLFSFAKLPPN